MSLFYLNQVKVTDGKHKIDRYITTYIADMSPGQLERGSKCNGFNIVIGVLFFLNIVELSLFVLTN